MRRILTCFNFYIVVVSYVLILVPTGYSQQANTKINSDAIWSPATSNMNDISTGCGYLRNEDLYACFIKKMQAANASDRAVEFAKLLGGRGYMKTFKPAGIVDIAYVHYPFEKEKREGCIIVNGNPALVDADDFSLLNLNELENNPDYVQLEKKYSHISLFAGDRKSNGYPLQETLPGQGERIVVNYELRDGCSSCELIGYADFGFDFDSTGNYMGEKFISVKKSVILDSVLIEDRNPRNVFSNPSQAIEVSEGEVFVIALLSNHSTGFKWELAEPLDENVVTLLGSNFLIPNETLPNAAGKETWSFRAKSKGATVIKFRYVRDWQNSTKELQNISFTLEVN
jgi:predicted secreted protein